MKFYLTSLVLVFCMASAYATTYTYETAGDWSDQSHWDVYPGTSVAASDSIIISADLIIDVSVTIHGYLEIDESSSFTMDWLLTLNGDVVNHGEFIEDSQTVINGNVTNHGDWNILPDGQIIITNTATFYTDGTMVNDGFVLCYNNAELDIEGDFTNNDDMTINANVNINLDANEQFTNNGFCQYNWPVRLEGKLVNNLGATFNVNPSSLLTIADNSTLSNFGIINVKGTCHLSSLIQSESALGHVKVTGSLIVKDFILEVL